MNRIVNLHSSNATHATTTRIITLITQNNNIFTQFSSSQYLHSPHTEIDISEFVTARNVQPSIANVEKLERKFVVRGTSPGTTIVEVPE